MRNSIFTLLVFITFIGFSANAQIGSQDSAFTAGLIYVNYGYEFPGGDLAKRFGNNSAIGPGIAYKTDKNWFFGAGFDYLFGGQVKENNLFRNIQTSEGEIIDQEGTYADVFMYERGYNISFRFGRIFSSKKVNPNSGILATFGGNFLQHKIRIENPNNSAPQIKGDYKKGYDRLTNGWGISEFIGYVYFGEQKIFNFFGGIEMTQAWTKNKRDFNFDTRSKDNSTRLDMLFGIKIGWIFPFYKRSNQVFYYY